MIKKHKEKESEKQVKSEEIKDAEKETLEIEDEVVNEEIDTEVIEEKDNENCDEVQENVISEHELEIEKLNKNLNQENNKLNNEIDALKDRLLRLSAEYDNFRKRTVKEKEGIYNDACGDVLKNILPIYDNLEKAANAEGDIDSLKQGIEMTLRQFNDSLGKLDVSEIPTDIAFDPNLHNAVMHVEDENLDKNVIVEVFQKGYKRGDKVIRYSMVKVAN